MASKQPKAEISLFKTPTANNGGVPWSVGVLNLSKDEARRIAMLVSEINFDRERPEQLTGLRPALVTATSKFEVQPLRCTHDYIVGDGCPYCEQNALMSEARKFIGGDWTREEAMRLKAEARRTEREEDIVRDGARQPEPEEERNRFSGLDLDP